MTATAVAPAVAFAAALQGAPHRILGFDACAHPTMLDTRRWHAEPSRSDRVLVEHCVGATVDIGCGPGRMTAALVALGLPALGIDIVPEAVRQTNARGGMAIERDVFDRVPGEGRWDSALLADGNVGIGGDPVRLLRRVAQIIAPSGRVVLDVAPPGGSLCVHEVALEVGGRRTASFGWAVVPADRIAPVAAAAALRTLSLVETGGRWFAVLAKAGGRG
jgi:SAM-dependent methyltransferase